MLWISASSGSATQPPGLRSARPLTQGRGRTRITPKYPRLSLAPSARSTRHLSQFGATIRKSQRQRILPSATSHYNITLALSEFSAGRQNGLLLLNRQPFHLLNFR